MAELPVLPILKSPEVKTDVRPQTQTDDAGTRRGPGRPPGTGKFRPATGPTGTASAPGPTGTATSAPEGGPTFTDPTGGTPRATEERRRPGRPPGSATREKKSTNDLIGDIADMVYGIHAMTAAMLQAPQWALDQEESKKLAEAGVKLAAQYEKTHLDPRKLAWAKFMMVCGGIYGPRLAAEIMKERPRKPGKLVALDRPEPHGQAPDAATAAGPGPAPAPQPAPRKTDGPLTPSQIDAAPPVDIDPDAPVN